MPPEDRPIEAAVIESGRAIALSVNGADQEMPAPCTVADLLDALQMSGRRVAVAVNRDVVVRSRYREVELSEGDRIEILEAVGGG